MPDPKGEGTFNRWMGHRKGCRIDWVLTSKHFHVVKADIIRDEYDSRYTSDHFPITATVRMHDNSCVVYPGPSE